MSPLIKLKFYIGSEMSPLIKLRLYIWGEMRPNSGALAPHFDHSKQLLLVVGYQLKNTCKLHVLVLY